MSGDVVRIEVVPFYEYNSYCPTCFKRHMIGELYTGFVDPAYCEDHEKTPKTPAESKLERQRTGYRKGGFVQ